MDEVLQQLSNTVQQLQTMLSKMEQKLDRTVAGMRLLLQSSTVDLRDGLLFAVKHDDVQGVLFFLELGANIEFQDGKKNRPIHVAVKHNHSRILQVLLENGADIESHGEQQKTALHLSSNANCFECAKILVEKGANLNSIDECQWTSVMFAANEGFDDIVELLLQKGANVNAATKVGWTALHLASREGKLSTVKILVKYGADVKVKGKDPQETTPLSLALTNGWYLIADFLQIHCPVHNACCILNNYI